MNDFSKDFIENFLEESADHLTAINQNLLSLDRLLSTKESGAGEAITRINLINDLFRSFHSLKGLAGMVGLTHAEELSHRLESVLRSLQKAEITLDGNLIDLLLEGTGVLEGIVAGVKNPQADPPNTVHIMRAVDDLLARADRDPAEPTSSDNRSSLRYHPGYPNGAVQPLAPSPQPDPAFVPYPEIAAQLRDLDHQAIEAARREGLLLALIFFTPSAEKAAQGINVAQLREKISEESKIIKAIPIVKGAEVRFVFLVAAAKLELLEDLPETEIILLNGHLPQLHPPGEPLLLNTYPPEGVHHSPQASHLNTVRVELEKLDDLMRLVGEMIVSRSRLGDVVQKFQQHPFDSSAKPLLGSLEVTVEQLEKHLRDLRQAVMRARMVPLAEVFNFMPLVVRDLARSTGKEVRLVIQGEQTEIDKMLVERLLNPLMHLVRNAITHGIELPSERLAAGKPSEGTISFKASLQGDQIQILVQDDGRGIDVDKVRQKAAASGIFMEQDIPLTNPDILVLISRPGFSTLEEANLAAGRGVGLEVVATVLRSVGGHLSLETEPGQGTIFNLRLPLTLTIFDAIIIRSGEETYGIPLYAVEEVIEFDTVDIVSVESGELIPFRESSLALVRLSKLFKIKSTENSLLYGIIGAGDVNDAVLVVDKVAGMQEIVLRSSSDPLIAQPGILGYSELGDGRVILVLDIPDLLQQRIPYAKKRNDGHR